jgi:ectoine hydroxylase
MELTDEQLRRFEEDGFLILPGVFSAAEVDLLRAQLPALFAERRPEKVRQRQSGVVRMAMGVHRRKEAFARLLRHPRLSGPAR